MSRAELKKQAKESLKGRWGKAIALSLVYQLVIGAFSAIANYIPIVGSIAYIVLAIPLSLGYTGAFLKFARNEDVGYLDFFHIGTKKLGKFWSITGNEILKLLGYIIAYVVCVVAYVIFAIYAVEQGEEELLIIGSIIMGVLYIIITIMMAAKSYYYSLTSYLGNEEDDLDGKQVVNKSEQLMKGHRMELFILNLSFIGWSLLSILTLGIGLLWLNPYMEMTIVKFYENLLDENNSNNVISEN